LGRTRADLTTAVLAVNIAAAGAMQALRERAFVFPHDMALDCFDDVEHRLFPHHSLQ
jgi:DNA-binding LacI/PurR family transcriptional regulator